MRNKKYICTIQINEKIHQKEITEEQINNIYENSMVENKIICLKNHLRYHFLPSFFGTDSIMLKIPYRDLVDIYIKDYDFNSYVLIKHSVKYDIIDFKKISECSVNNLTNNKLKNTMLVFKTEEKAEEICQKHLKPKINDKK